MQLAKDRESRPAEKLVISTRFAALHTNPVRALLLIACLLAPLALPAQDDSPVLPGTVTRVVDGDTLDVQIQSGPIRVRIYGTDTPEKGQPYGKVAEVALRALVMGKSVELVPVSQDRYERMVAIVLLNGTEVGLTLIEKGYAWAYRQYLGGFEGDEGYCRAEAQARAEHRGLWSLPATDRRAPWEWRKRGKGKRYTNWETETVADCVAAIGK